MVDICGVIKRYDDLKRDKQPWISLYMLISEYVRQRKQSFTTFDFNNAPFTTIEVFDNTAGFACTKAAAAFMGSLFPNGAKTIRITKPHGVADSLEVKSYFKEVTLRLVNAMDSPRAGLATSLDEYGQDQMCYAVGGVSVVDTGDVDHPFQFSTWDVSRMHIAENYTGFVDTVYYEQLMTVRQVIEEYGFGVVSPEIQNAYLSNKMTDKVNILRVIEPRVHTGGQPAGNKGLPFASYHIEVNTKRLLKESGYLEMPIVIGRFSKLAGETYARSCAMAALPDILELNKVRDTRVVGTEAYYQPPLMLNDPDAVGSGIVDTSPNGLTVAQASRISNQRAIEPLYQVNEMQTIAAHVEELRNQVTQHFYIDRLLDLNNETRMTLGEAQLRNKLRGDSLTSIFSRQELEFFTPLINLCFNIMFRKKLLGVEAGSLEEAEAILMGEEPLVIPDVILKRIRAGREAYSIQYLSPAKRMMHAEEIQGIMTTWEFAGNLAGVDPSLLDNLDSDETIRRLAELTGSPVEIVRDVQSIKAIREARVQQQQAAAMLEMARSGSETARNFAQAESTNK
jgi:hypothetical protein